MIQDLYDEELDPYFDLDWIAVQGSDVNAVVDALRLENSRQGSFVDFGETANTFVYLSKSDWVIIIHQWEPRGSSEKYLNAVEQVIIALSQRFGEAQSFACYQDTICYTHWMLAKNGFLLRSFAKASETSLFRNHGEITEVEKFIDWRDKTLFLGSLEVIKIAKQWSVEPIFADYPEQTEGVLGCYNLCDN